MSIVRTCLIGEADPFIARLLQRFAEEIGLHVERAQVGEALVESASQFQPELVILDPELPGQLRGWEAMKAIHTNPSLEFVPVILCSWLPEIQARTLAADNGGASCITGYLRKPDLHYQDFLDAVQSAGVPIPNPDASDASLDINGVLHFVGTTASAPGDPEALTVTSAGTMNPANGGGALLMQVLGLKKAFPGVLALAGVDFDLRPGEVHALVGENGAGKSTLIKILSGVYAPDGGNIIVAGEEFSALTPRQAHELGIRTIYQERSLAPELSVAENIMVGSLPGRGFLVNWNQVYEKAGAVLSNLELDLDPTEQVCSLGIAKQQAVEMAKALYQKARIVIMDEPTSAFGRAEVERLFKTVRALRQQGIGVIYISHHLEEIFEISDRVTVLRDGQVVGSRLTSNTTPQELMTMMVGRDLSGEIVKQTAPTGEVMLRLEDVGRGVVVKNISLELRRGEIVGIAGMVGSGRSELARLIFGLDRYERGRIVFKEHELRANSPRSAIRRGIGLIPEDRKLQGLVLCLDLIDNTNMVSIQQQKPFLSLSRLRENVRRYIQTLDIRTPSLNREVQYLSGGNQQKIVLAKWLDAGADLLIFDEPTRGVDVGAKMQIHRLIVELAHQGRAILMISSDLPEILALSDRILVMRKGQIVGEFDGKTANENGILACALGEGNGANGH
jgi:ribose transport system ATP-binding protein